MRLFYFIFTVLFASQVWASSPTDLRSFGKSSPVKMYLFTSLTCPHCADFHSNILPTLKKEYADTGKAQIIVVDMTPGTKALSATQILRCLDGSAAEKFEKDLYKNQSKWMNQQQQKAEKIIGDYAFRQGMKSEQFNLCLKNKQLQSEILEQQRNLARLYGITKTPTLVLRNGSLVYKWSGSDTKIFKEIKEALP